MKHYSCNLTKLAIKINKREILRARFKLLWNIEPTQFAILVEAA